MCGVGLFAVAMRTSAFAFPDSFYKNNANGKRFGREDDRTGSRQINENSVLP